MNTRNTRLAALLLASASLAGCDADDATDPNFGMGQLELTSDVLADTDVAQIHYTATEVDCVTGEPIVPAAVFEAVEDLVDAFLPGGNGALENAPLDAGSQHLFADHFFWLPQGCYSVDIAPLNSDGEPSEDCAPASNPNVAVFDGQTTEIMLISQCDNDPAGGLDVIAVINHAPQIVDLTYSPSKFVCTGEVEVCIEVSDPDNDPLAIEWDEAAQIISTSETPTASGTLFCAVFSVPEPGDYTYGATVYDLGYDEEGNPITLEDLQGGDTVSHDDITFPIHALSEDACIVSCECPDAPVTPLRLPLEPGQQVATCSSRGEGNFVIGVIDARTPECFAEVDENWSAPMYHNEAAVSPTGDPAHVWTGPNLGELFGVALDDAAAPNIYATTTTSYGVGGVIAGNAGRVWKLDGMTGEPTLLANLPNFGAGLGNIAHDRTHQQLFVTNFEDGKIYRLDMAGTVLETFDPFNADDGTEGFAPLTDRIWGVQVYGCHLYFGTWNADGERTGPDNTVWSLEIAGDGSLVGPEVLQLTVSQGKNQPISDIAFSAGGKMMIAQRGMRSDTQPQPHNSNIFEYEGGHGAWVPSANTYGVGAIAGGSNTAGGVDYDCADECDNPTHVAATGDALHINAPENIYGVQILPSSGGTVANSFLVDLDNNTVGQDKTQLGDVDYVRPCAARAPECRGAQGDAEDGAQPLPQGEGRQP